MLNTYTQQMVIFVLYLLSQIIVFALFCALVLIIFSIVAIDFIFVVFSRLSFDVDLFPFPFPFSFKLLLP